MNIARIILALLIAAPAVTGAPGLLTRLFGSLSYDEVLELSDSPKDLARHGMSRVVYKAEPSGAPDEWLTGRETWDRRGGDCEDLAALMVSFCHSKGFHAEQRFYINERLKVGHSVAVGEFGGRWWLCDNTRFWWIKGEQEVVKSVARSCRWRVANVKRSALHEWLSEDIGL